ncbi:MAG TPA: STAS domain-containing protein [Acidimicrobiales bacterium]|nr:STAS domain-containing protein [Acidimicrobiales bacterium]
MVDLLSGGQFLCCVEEGPPPVLIVAGELDAVTRPALMNAAAQACARGRHPAFIDASRLRFIDSVGLCAIERVVERCHRHHRSFPATVIGASAWIARIFRLAGVGHLLAVEDDIVDGLAGLAG